MDWNKSTNKDTSTSSSSRPLRKATLVKSCPKLESGLRLGQEGIHACQLGPFSSPLFWTADEAAQLDITREMIVEKRRWLFELLNDPTSPTPCKHCGMVITKSLDSVRFDRLGHIDLAADTLCNLRCRFCGYTRHNSFSRARYDALKILQLFEPEDVEWNSAVDFNGGEPTLLKDFDQYIAFFHSRRIRVFLYTNGTIYRQAVFEGLKSGTIRWACISLDSGIPSTYQKLKASDSFHQVLENIARYARAGEAGAGQVSVKHIFSEDNCSDDDISGFTYAMLALRPQEVWLTFDFEPLQGLPGDLPTFGDYDYSKHIFAYAKTFVMLKKHGFTPVHFPEKHMGPVSAQGKLFLKACRAEIQKLLDSFPSAHDENLFLEDFRRPREPFSRTIHEECHVAVFHPSPPRIRREGQDWHPVSLDGKHLALAPASPATETLMSLPEMTRANIEGIFDRDCVLHGKTIAGVPIYPYDHLRVIKPDYIVVTAGDHIRRDVISTLLKHAESPTCILIYIPS